jgi:hypothetical protein
LRSPTPARAQQCPSTIGISSAGAGRNAARTSVFDVVGHGARQLRCVVASRGWGCPAAARGQSQQSNEPQSFLNRHMPPSALDGEASTRHQQLCRLRDRKAGWAGRPHYADGTFSQADRTRRRLLAPKNDHDDSRLNINPACSKQRQTPQGRSSEPTRVRHAAHRGLWQQSAPNEDFPFSVGMRRAHIDADVIPSWDE